MPALYPQGCGSAPADGQPTKKVVAELSAPITDATRDCESVSSRKSEVVTGLCCADVTDVMSAMLLIKRNTVAAMVNVLVGETGNESECLEHFDRTKFEEDSNDGVRGRGRGSCSVAFEYLGRRIP